MYLKYNFIKNICFLLSIICFLTFMILLFILIYYKFFIFKYWLLLMLIFIIGLTSLKLSAIIEIKIEKKIIEN